MPDQNTKTNFPKIPDSEFEKRVQVFKQKMTREKFDLVIFYSNYIEPSAVRYFSDFFPINENGALIIPLKGDPILCSGQACHDWSRFKSKVKDIRIMPEVGEVSGVEYDIDVVDFDDLFAELKQKYSVNKIGIVGELTFPQVIFGKMKKAFPQADIAPAEKILYEMRVSKSENELACIRKAGEIIDHTFEYALNRIKPGATELDVQADLMYMMLHLGAEDHTLSWAPMIPSGKENSNLCMNRNSMKKIEEGEIVNVDAGVLYEGYNAVMCTPVILGKVPEEMRKAILTAWDASRTVANALKPGATSKQLFKIYADFLANTGYSKFSPYGSVHSLGMLECEPPFFSNKRDVILAENAVVAIDAYFANLPWGSFRIEDTFIVKSNGFEPVTKFNSEYLKRYL